MLQTHEIKSSIKMKTIFRLELERNSHISFKVILYEWIQLLLVKNYPLPLYLFLWNINNQKLFEGYEYD